MRELTGGGRSNNDDDDDEQRQSVWPARLSLRSAVGGRIKRACDRLHALAFVCGQLRPTWPARGEEARKQLYAKFVLQQIAAGRPSDELSSRDSLAIEPIDSRRP